MSQNTIRDIAPFTQAQCHDFEGLLHLLDSVTKHISSEFQDRFVRLAKKSYIPDRQSPAYNKAVRQRHAAILGICALVESYPYTVEKWMPDLLTSVLAEHTYDPVSNFYM